MYHRGQFIDLTQIFDENSPLWPGCTPLHRSKKVDYDTSCLVYDYQYTAGIGTHIDAPLHFIKNARAIHDYEIEELIAPACVIDVCEQSLENPDYLISRDDILKWEKQHGVIEEKNIVLTRTGWSQFWSDPAKYQNKDAEGKMHFPGYSAEAAKLLVDRKVKGVGIDTLSLDSGLAKNFPAHHVFLGADLFLIENLNNLDRLPAKESMVFCLPIKIRGGAEAPARIFAWIP